MTNFQKIVIGILIVVAIFIAYYFGYFLPKNNAQMLELQRQSLVLQAEKNEQERITKQQEKQQEEVDDIFRKNQECQTYKAGLDQDIPGASLTNVIFYSPSEKDCIVVQTFIAN